MSRTSQQKGFTLIELIMVIVILGVLSAFALPRFADFGANAERASVEGARASVQSAAGIVRSTALVNGLGNATSGSVSVEGVSIAIANGYIAASGVSTAAQLDDFFIAGATGTAGSQETYISVLDSDGNASAGSPCFTFEEGEPPTISPVDRIVSGGSCVAQ